MVVHELATNAAKYGALSAPGGSVDVHWELEDSRLHIRWREKGGPPAAKPDGTGFGFQLLHGEIEYRLRGNLETNFHPDGLAIRISVPHTELGT
jgi:two-component system CheB/CheR fusion protein